MRSFLTQPVPALPLSRWRLATVLGALVVAVAACGGATTGVASSQGDAGQDAGPVSTTGSSGGSGNGSSGGSSSGSGDAALATGTILLQAFGGASGEVAAQVPLLEPGVGPQRTCGSPVVAGACQLLTCAMGGIGSPGGGYGDYGPITASVGTSTIAIDYDGTGYPTEYFPSSVTLGTGGSMTFHGGNGSDVPTFDVTATIPGVAVLTAPLPATAGGAATVDTTQDLSVTWSPIAIGQIHFELDGGSDMPGGTAVSLACTFDGASGAGVVARSLLASLKQGSGANPTYASVNSELDATTTVGGLEIQTQSFQTSPTSLRSFDVTLE